MQELRFYRIGKDKGTGVKFNISIKKNEKGFNETFLFLKIAPQTGKNPKTDNATFDWENKSITVKLGLPDVGEIVSVIENRQEKAGANTNGLFHSFKDTNKIIRFEKGTGDYNNYMLNVSVKTRQDKSKFLRIFLAQADAILLREYLLTYLKLYYTR